MKQTMKYLSMAALVLVGAILASCAKNETELPQEDTPEVIEPDVEDNIVVCTTTVSFDTDATKALDDDGVKTFAAGERIAVIYENTSEQTVKAVSSPLPSGDYGNTATFTVSLTNPKTNSTVRIIYPAAMASDEVDYNIAVDSDETINYAALNTQDGTLATLSSNLDLAVYDGNLEGTALPADPALKNKLAICLYTIKNSDGSNEITSAITGMTISDGTNNYTVNRSAAAGPIYVAIRPTSDATIYYTATDGTNRYNKTVTGKTYAASQMYPLGLRMAEYTGINLAVVTTDCTAQHGDVIYGTLGENHKISIAAGATVTLSNVNINGSGTWTSGNYAGLNCLGNATIILEDGTTNTVKGFYEDYPGIHVPEGSTLTIDGETAGTGSLTASSNGYGAGIGGGHVISCGGISISGGKVTATGGYYAAGIGAGRLRTCGTITISGGTITATGGYGGAGIGGGHGEGSSCGDITISGGAITATGGQYAAGIGSGYNSSSSGITIASTVTRVTATKGSDAPNSIGAGDEGSCGTVTIGGVVYWDGSAYQNDGATYLTQATIVYPVPSFAINGSGTKVVFAPGNLQATYDGSSWSWAFATNQWDYIGNETANNKINGNGTVSANGTVDLFGWSTSATTLGINNSTDIPTYSGDFADWGDNANVQAGIGTGWRTLTKDEWTYVFNNRTSGSTVNGISSARYTEATINTDVTGINGMILFPDGVTIANDEATSWGDINNRSSWGTKCTSAQWTALAAKGCVFLPAAGNRWNRSSIYIGEVGYYWSSSPYNSERAYIVYIGSNSFTPATYKTREYGYSVRLVHPVE